MTVVGLGRLVRAVLPGRACRSSGSRCFWLAGRRRARRRLFHASPHVAEPHRPLPRSHDRRQLPGRPLDRRLHEWRPLGPRPGRRHGEECRCPTPMPISSSPSPARSSASSSASSSSRCSPSSCCAASRALLQENNLFVVLAATGLLVAVRPAGHHQHGLDAASDADQGHDPALHLLRRLVAARARPRHGHGAGADAHALRRERTTE